MFLYKTKSIKSRAVLVLFC